MEFFRTERLSPSTTRITDLTQVSSFLVVGEEKAALLDTGTGLGDLKAFVETLTDKPVTVLLTHGHGDHASGAAPFEEVYLSEKDWDIVRQHDSMEMKMGYAQSVMGEGYSAVSDADFCPPRTGGYLPLEDGQVFDLGGVTLEALAVPGHTQGMTCILNREERSILFGDACNTYVYLWLGESSSVAGYQKALLALKEREGEYDTVYLSHPPFVAKKGILDEVIELCGELMDGRSDEAPFQVPPAFAGRRAFVAKAVDEHLRRLDGKDGNIVYDPERIF